MCSPTLAFTAISISTIAGFVQSRKVAKQQDAAAVTNRQIAVNNAEIETQKANDAIVRGNIKEQNRRRQTLIDRGSQQAKFGASGITIGEGSSALILEDTAQIGELDALQIRNNAEREAFFNRKAANNLLFAGDANFQFESNQADNTRADGIGSLLAGGGRVASKWYKFKNPVPAGGTCWVAREVYGVDNFKWLLFRSYLLNDAPDWFRKLYIKYGERFAVWIKHKSILKFIIRKWMDTKVI